MMAAQAEEADPEFFRLVLDAMSEHVAVVDMDGVIVYVNRPWSDFCVRNDGPSSIRWQGMNYRAVCEQAAADGDEFGAMAVEGLRRLTTGTDSEYALEYPCHEPDQQRWFMAQMTPLSVRGRDYIVISHHDITQRKLAEQKADALARTDGLVGIPNRTHLDEFLGREWKRAMRAGRELSVLLLDIDAFKPFNDHYGHAAGDDCLQRVGAAVHALHRRETDLVARYGGEEFVVVLAESDADQAIACAERVLATVRELKIVHEHSTAAPVVTVSIGVATMVPAEGTDESTILEAADAALYEAKAAGRDCYRVAEGDQ